MRRLFLTASAASLLLATGCFDDASMMPVDDEGYETLLQKSWTLESGKETWWCIRQTVTEDIYIDSIEALAPPGTHHTVLSAGFTPLADDGVSECNSYQHNFEKLLFESSSSLDRLVMPPGVATKVSAGMQLNLNIHIYDSTDGDLSGLSGVKIRRVDPANVDQFAIEQRFGKLSLDVPPGESTVSQDCPMDADGTFFAVLPHMHSHGTHMKLVAQSSVLGETVVMDEPYDYDATKAYYELAPEIPVKKGDMVTIYCSYSNETPWTLHWGPDGYFHEMCFAGVYMYPADGHNAFCSL